MSAPQLSVSITADLAGLRQGLGQATTATTTASGQMTAAIGQVDRSFQVLNNTRFTFGQNFRNQAAIVNNSIRPTTQAINRAGSTLTDFGRIAQDAPFGFIAIQNNLNPLLESFGRLRQETGSNAAAFRALGASLVGPAGLGIALSLVSSAISFYLLYQQRANKAANDAKKVGDDYIDTLNQVAQAQLKGATNAQKEITELQTLYAITQNTTLSLKQRNEAVDELQSKYPSYFKNLSDETIRNGEAKDAYDRLSQSIIATARARAAQDLITKNSTARLVNEQKIVDLQAEQIRNNEKAAKQSGGGYNPYGGSTAGVGAALKAQNTNLLLEQQIGEIKAKNNKLDEESARLVNAINEQIKQGADLTGKVGGSTKEEANKIADIYKQLITDLRVNTVKFDTEVDVVEANIQSYQKAIESLAENGYTKASKAVQDLINKQNELAKAFTDSKGVIQGSAPVSPSVAIPNTFNATIVDKNLPIKGISEYILLAQEAVRSTIRFEESLKSLANESIAGGISEAFSSIGEAFANGTSAIDAFGEAILSAFASFLSQLGQMFIKEGIAQIGYGIAKNIILPGSGANNISGGIGMIAAGAGIAVIGGALGARNKGNSKSGENQPRNIPQFASGVNNFRGGMALVGERGAELVNLPTGSSVVPNFRTSQMLSENRGETNIVIDGQIRGDARGLYLMLEAEGRKLGRSGYGK